MRLSVKLIATPPLIDNCLPAKSLLVIAVDLASLLELGDELLDALGIILSVEVNDESVDHVCG